jgi:threonine synthase
MDIQISSNFERYLFEASGRDAGLVRSLMGSLAVTRRFALGDLWPSLKADFAAVSASEADVAACSRSAKVNYGYDLDPHSACALVAADRTGRGETVVLATAHPAKFPEAVGAITGVRPSLPGRLAHLMSNSERFATLPNSLAAVEDFILNHCRVASGVTR